MLDSEDSAGEEGQKHKSFQKALRQVTYNPRDVNKQDACLRSLLITKTKATQGERAYYSSQCEMAPGV